MRKFIQSLLMCTALCCLLTSCVSKKKFEELMNDKTTIDQVLAENQRKVQELQKNVENLETEKEELGETLQTETTRLTDEVAAVKDDLMTSKQEMEKMETMVASRDSQLTTMQERIRSTFDVYTKGGFNLSSNNNNLTINTPSPIRFRSGSTRVDQDSKMILNDLAERLKQNPMVKVLVEGHTDNVPMKSGARFKDNKELSMARASRVVDELVKLGVSPSQLAATGRGDSMPKYQDENDSEEVRAMNRRTEFVVMANVGPLFEMSQGM